MSPNERHLDYSRIKNLIERIKKPYFQYLLLVSFIGSGLLLFGIYKIPSYHPYLIFILLIGLAMTAQLSTASFPIGDKAGITYQVAPAIAAAAIPFFGPFAAVIVDVIAALTLWVLKPADERTWKKSWEQLAFNIGMNAVAMVCAGLVFIWIRSNWGGESIWQQPVPWLFAAVVNDQVSLWLLIGIMKLSQGSNVRALTIWRENIWAMVIGIILFSVGGGLLSFSIREFGWIGGAVFFLPIVLSSFAFRQYVRQMQAHLDNLEEIISERTEELKHMMAEKDSFLAVLTHDMKTPLTGIGLYADILKAKPDILLEKPEIAGVIKRNQKQLLDIVENILDLEKVQTGEILQLDLTRFCVNTLIEEAIETLKPMAQKKNIAIEFYPAPEPIVYDGDIYHLGRVLKNLISNAIKYTAPEGRIEIRSNLRNGHVQIDVQDTGYGIPPDELSFIFDRFRRVKAHEKKAVGTGLGLAITKALVEAHGGRIVVDSEEGVGSTFSVRLAPSKNGALIKQPA